jgi:hypothetical protein
MKKIIRSTTYWTNLPIQNLLPLYDFRQPNIVNS